MKTEQSELFTESSVWVLDPSRTDEQKDYITKDKKANIILKATAGSGKTACAVDRVKFLIHNKVDPKKIIFFSYTTAAVEEFKKRLNNPDVKVTTIHAFCLGMLSRMKKYKDIVDIYKFIKWYQDKNKPSSSSPQQVKDEYYRFISKMYDDQQYIGSEITAFKLQTADGIKCKVPQFYKEYKEFTKETKSRDFSDMLIEVRELLKENKWLNMFKGEYEYIMVDEFQDTSTIQMQILLALNAQYYTVIGDISQSIFLYSGANAAAIIAMLKKRRNCIEMSLSVNFRSKRVIVENSNKYSNLQATAFSLEEGKIHNDILTFDELVNLLNTREEIAILARRNSDIKDIEYRLLMRKIPMRYFNYLTQEDISELRKAEARTSTTKKVRALLPIFKTTDNVINFIESNSESKSFVTSIHKSKGREFPVCVVVNSLSPELMEHNKLNGLPDEIKNKLSFDLLLDDDDNFEAKNIHYVAISRPKDELFYMVLNI